MLKDTKPQIKILKISTGEEIIATILDGDKLEYIVKNALQLVNGRNGPQFAPYLILADPSKEFAINRALVVAVASAPEEMERMYQSATSGIALPEKSSIIT